MEPTRGPEPEHGTLAPGRGRGGWRARLVAATVLVLGGVALPFRGGQLAPIALVLVVGGTAWLLFLLARPAPGETEAPLRRKQIALSIGTTMLMLVVLVVVGLSVRVRSSSDADAREGWREGRKPSPQMADPELGWSPDAPPDVVGQRLERVDPKRPRVLLMGDSIVYGYGVSDDQHVGRKLEQLLPGHQVLNGAVSGYSIDQYLLLLRRYVPATKPRLIVVGLFTGNDFQMTAREFGWGNTKPVLRVRDGVLVHTEVAAACIRQLSRSVLMQQLWRSRDLAEQTIQSICKPTRLGRTETEQSIAAMFDAMDRLATENGARILYVLLPVDSELEPYDPDRFLYVSRHPDLWRLLGEHPRERYDFAVDLFAKGADPRGLFQSDHAHLIPEGHVKLAAALAREIDARGLLRP